MGLDAELQRQLHERVLAGDPTASADIFQIIYPTVVVGLRQKWPVFRRSDAVRGEVVVAIAIYLKSPQRFDPDRCTLAHWIRLLADRALTTQYRSRDYQTASRIDLVDDVDEVVAQDRRRAPVEDRHPSDEESELLARVRAGFSERDRRLIQVLMDGDRSTAGAAAALGLDHLSAAEQRVAVTRAKDRVKKRLRRMQEGDVR